MRGHRPTLSGRLLLLFLLTALLLVAVVRTGFRYGVEGRFRELARPHLDEYVQHLLAELGDPPTPERASALAQRLPVQIHLLGDYRWSSAGTPPVSTPRRSVTRTLTDGTVVHVEGGRDGFVVRVKRGEVTVVFVPLGLQHADIAPVVVVLTICGVLLIMILAYHAIRRLFRPIETIRTGVARLGAGELEHRLDVHRRDELGELAESINAMADDIRAMLEAKRQMLLAVSHELRSPLTRARVNAELVNDSAARRALMKELGELETLLDELLEAERLRGRHATLVREAVDPSELLSQLVEEFFGDDRIQLDLDPPGTWLSLDPVRIRLLARNLLRNAIRHTPVGSNSPLLSSHVDAERWTLAVSDTGPGIAAQQVSRLTAPFYRADPSRQRKSGGVGLGLYLSRTIAEAHGGSLEIQSRPGHGTKVLVKIPVGDTG